MAQQELPTYLNHSPYFPNPMTCTREMVTECYKEVLQRLPASWDRDGLEEWLSLTQKWVYSSFLLEWTSLFVLPAIVCVILVLLRVVLSKLLLNNIPRWLKFEKESSEKFPESSWKAVCYTAMWVCDTYVLFVSSEKNYFFDLKSHWEDWTPGAPIETTAYYLYVFQLGFYYHCVYTTVYMDKIRKDFYVLMLHHFVTIGLLFFSYTVRFHKIGLLILFIHDFGDIFLELAKTTLYFKVRDGVSYFWPECGANVLFAIFTFQHVLFRLYWLFTKAIYSAMAIGHIVFPGGPFYLLFNPMLLTLYGMHVYWFKFIMKLIIKIVVYGEEIADNREDDDELKEDTKKKTE